MTVEQLANILLIDDQPETLGPLATAVENTSQATCRALSPLDLDEQILMRADLVVVDYTLSEWLSHFPDDDLCRRPIDGIALANVLRRYSEKLKDSPPTGYSLITGAPESLGPIPSEQRPHVISRLNNLEWFFVKQADTDKNVRQMVSLAKAIRALPQDAAACFGDFEKLADFLGVSASEPLRDRYVDAIKRCRPPIHNLGKWSHGLVVIRWLLHRILPHSCFLVNDLWLSARLWIDPSSLANEFAVQSELARQLNALGYRGPLADFDEKRWWRDGVEQWLWDTTEGQSANQTAVRKIVADRATSNIAFVELAQPVVTINENLAPERTLSSYDDVVALQLDDWPGYAEPPYMRKQLLDTNPQCHSFQQSVVQ